ncbi:molybdate-anion transporter-like isoform X2 [Ischnura elegans]|nr:molybdate-anion transporter-like isoform X2 [Ischnura elegans]
MKVLAYVSIFILGAISLFFHGIASRTKPQVASGNDPSFLRFQKSYFKVYFLALFSDWLQGPYLYKLYSHYGFEHSQIAFLYVVGFAASGLLGTITGSIADHFGRKKTCVAYTVLSSVCCLTKMSSNFYILVFGRVMGGISTSMLFSCFEAWYVHEHVEARGFPSEWVPVTLSKSTFWGGVLAMVAGIVANGTAEWAGLGPLSPFLLALAPLAISGAMVILTWPENVGQSKMLGSETSSVIEVFGSLTKFCMEGLRCIWSREVIFLLGLIQSLFESVMYTFVFLWTPVLEPGHPPLGVVFSCFMLCMMIGSSLYSILIARGYSSQQILAVAVGLAMGCITWCVIASGPRSSFAAFLLLEIAVGLYYPSTGHLRSHLLPEEVRANVTNWFRVPMNFLTCGGLLWLCGDNASPQIAFGASSFLLLFSFVLSARLIQKCNHKSSIQDTALSSTSAV